MGNGFNWSSMKCVAACALILLPALNIMSRPDKITFPIARRMRNVLDTRFQCAYASCLAGYSFECPAPLSSVCGSAAQKFKVHGARDPLNAKCSRTKDTANTTCFLGLSFGFPFGDLREKEVHWTAIAAIEIVTRVQGSKQNYTAISSLKTHAFEYHTFSKNVKKIF